MFANSIDFGTWLIKSKRFYKKYMDLKARIQINDALLDKCMQPCCRNMTQRSKNLFSILSIIFIIKL